MEAVCGVRPREHLVVGHGAALLIVGVELVDADDAAVGEPPQARAALVDVGGRPGSTRPRIPRGALRGRRSGRSRPRGRCRAPLRPRRECCPCFRRAGRSARRLPASAPSSSIRLVERSDDPIEEVVSAHCAGAASGRRGPNPPYACAPPVRCTTVSREAITRSPALRCAAARLHRASWRAAFSCST